MANFDDLTQEPTPADSDHLIGYRTAAIGGERRFTLSGLWAYFRAKLTTTPATIAEGGTGSATASAARSALDLTIASQAEADTGAVSRMATAAATRRIMRAEALAKFHESILTRQAAAVPINIIVNGDSLSSSGNYITPLRDLFQHALGDGGLGWQPWSVWAERGSNVNYPDWTGYDQNTANAPTGVQQHFPGLVGVLGETGDSNTTFSFTGGSDAIRAASTYDLWYVATPAGGTFTSSTPDGDSVSGIDSLNDPYLLQKQAMTGVKTDNSSGTYANVTSVSGDVGLAGINVKMGTTGVRVHAMGIPSSTAEMWASLDSTSTATFLADIDPDMAIIELGMNDRGGRTATEYEADIRTLVARYRAANADCVIVLIASNNDALANATLTEYRAKLVEIAADSDCEFIDSAWLVDSSLIDVDTIHYTATGYKAKAVNLFRYLGGPGLPRSNGATPYGQTYAARSIDAASVAGYIPGAGLTENTVTSETDEHLILSAANTNKSVYARYSGSGSFIISDRNNTTYQLVAKVGSTYAQLQAQTSGSGYRELRLNPSGGAVDVGGDLEVGDDLTVIGDTILATKTPASASATGTTGQIAWDADYIYICTATNTWKRVAISTW